jgi:ABC-type glycerol-3-phosphate transport system substrate-binding protein
MKVHITKNRTFIVLLACLVLILAACQQVATEAPAEEEEETATETEEQESEEPSEEIDEASEETTAPEEREPVTLRFYQWAGQPHEGIHEEVINAFMEEHPWITVQIEAVPFNEFFPGITAQAAANNLPDVLAGDMPETQHLAFNGLVQPLTPDVYSSEEVEDFIPSMVDELTYQDQLWGVTVRTSSIALFYNADMLADAGIEAPVELENGWTMEEAREVWNTLTVRDSLDAPAEVYGVIGRRGEPFCQNSYHGVGMIRSAGEPGSPTYMGISEDGLTVDGYLNTPEAIDALQFCQDLHQADGVAPLETIPNGFETGVAATYEHPENLIPVLESTYPDINWGVTPLPYFETGFSHTGSFAYYITRDTENFEEAAMLVRWLANEENSLLWVQEGQQLPVRKSVFEQITDYEEYPRRLFYETLTEWGEPRPQTPGFREYSQAVGQMLNDIVLGAPVEERVEQAVSEIDNALSAYR